MLMTKFGWNVIIVLLSSQKEDNTPHAHSPKGLPTFSKGRSLSINSFDPVVVVVMWPFCSRADCSQADKPGAKPTHNGLTPFGKVKKPTFSQLAQSLN